MAKIYNAKGECFAYAGSTHKVTYEGPQKRQDKLIIRPSLLLRTRHPELRAFSARPWILKDQKKAKAELERWQALSECPV